jgi:hypothetical protein
VRPLAPAGKLPQPDEVAGGVDIEGGCVALVRIDEQQAAVGGIAEAADDDLSSAVAAKEEAPEIRVLAQQGDVRPSVR